MCFSEGVLFPLKRACSLTCRPPGNKHRCVGFKGHVVHKPQKGGPGSDCGSVCVSLMGFSPFPLPTQGTTIKPIVKLLKVRTQADHKMTMNEAIHCTVGFQPIIQYLY